MENRRSCDVKGVGHQGDSSGGQGRDHSKCFIKARALWCLFLGSLSVHINNLQG